MLSPATPILVDRDVRVTTVGQDGYFAMAGLDNLETYTVIALVPSGGTASGSSDASALRAAGTAYPVEVVGLLTAEQTGVVGPNLRALKDEIVSTAASSATLDRVERLLQVLGTPPYTYDVNTADQRLRAARAVAECRPHPAVVATGRLDGHAAEQRPERRAEPAAHGVQTGDRSVRPAASSG